MLKELGPDPLGGGYPVEDLALALVHWESEAVVTAICWEIGFLALQHLASSQVLSQTQSWRPVGKCLTSVHPRFASDSTAWPRPLKACGQN